MGLEDVDFFGQMFSSPLYTVVALIISIGIGAYVWGLLLRKEDPQRRAIGTAIAVVVPLVLLLLLAGFLGTHILRDWPVLSLVTFIPLLGAIIILCLPKDRADWIQWTALLVSFFPLGLAIMIWLGIGDASQMQFQEVAVWIQQIGVAYHMGVDGISVPMVFLTSLLTTLATLYSFIIKDRPKEYFAFLLLLEMAMIGVFVSLNFFLFYIFWELSLVPMYFLIGLWGAPPRKEGKMIRGGPYAAIKFFIYTLAGSVGILLAILGIYFSVQGKIPALDLAAGNYGPFDIMALTEWVGEGNQLFTGVVGAALAFWAMFIGFAIKVPSFPFHTWLPDAHVDAPTAGSVILAGVLLKLGAYGLIRILFPLFPAEFQKFAPIIVILAVISIVYGALVAMAQWDLKKLIAYSSVNHMGYVTLGIAVAAIGGATVTSRAIALSGSVLQMFNHGIITGGLFFLVGVIYERVHTRDLHVYGGLRRLTPVYAGIWGITCMASLGLPGLAGFVSEFMVFRGSFGAALEMAAETFALLSPGWVLALVAIGTLGIVIGAAYMLWTVQRMLFGQAKEGFEEMQHHGHLFDMDLREILTLTPLLGFMLAIGVYPAFIVDTINAAVTALLK